MSMKDPAVLLGMYNGALAVAAAGVALRPKARADLPKAISQIPGFGFSRADLEAAGTATLEDFPPTLFLVGAPRCGTTAISKALAGHPVISFSKPKETHYLLEPRGEMTEGAWRALYLKRYHQGLSRQHQATIDGSVSYLYSPEAIERALEFDPRARFMVMVRNPVDMLRSYHARMLFQLDEDVEDFAKAWALQQSRAAGHDLPKRCRDPRLLQYGEAGQLGKHVERLFEVAGRERCLAVVFDDWVRNSREVYLRVLDFIGLEDDGRTDFRRKRETTGFRSTWLQQFVMNPPAWALRLVALSNTAQIKRLKGLRKRIKSFNTRDDKRPPLSEEMRDTLRRYFADDVKKLSRLLSRDLSHWS